MGPFGLITFADKTNLISRDAAEIMLSKVNPYVVLSLQSSRGQWLRIVAQPRNPRRTFAQVGPHKTLKTCKIQPNRTCKLQTSAAPTLDSVLAIALTSEH
jgi:hypothetical protein